MSDPTAGTHGFVAGLIKALELMPDGEARDQVQAICDGVQARDSEGAVHWMTEDGIAVWVRPWKRDGLWLAFAQDSLSVAQPNTVRDTRQGALAATVELLAMIRERETQRVAGRMGR